MLLVPWMYALGHLMKGGLCLGRTRVPSEVYRADNVEILHPALAIPRPIAMGALWGLIAWSGYGLLEFFLSAVYPMMTRASAVFTIENWRINAVLFDCYWVLGALSGALMGALT